MKDPRQKFFTEAVELIETHFENTQTNDNENIMFASAVNLGKLQDTITELMKKKEIKNEKDIIQFIASSVQRPKQIKTEPWRDEFNHCNRYKISLVTKDDYGYYEYGFNTRPIK